METQNSTSTRANTPSDLTISVLNRIFDFSATSGPDAVLRLGTVSTQWRDTLLYCPAMWQRLIEERWPTIDKNAGDMRKKLQSAAAPFRGPNRWSMQSFRARFITQIHALRGQKDFAEIENCVAPDFQFRCPILVQNLVTLKGEINPNNGLPIMFCDICEKKVHPVNNIDELKDCASDQRCVYMPESLQRAIHEGKKYVKPTPPKNDDDIRDNDGIPPPPQLSLAKKKNRYNIAVVVSSESTNAVEAGYSVLKLILKVFADDLTPPKPKDINGTLRRPKMPSDLPGEVDNFLSKNLLKIHLDRPQSESIIVARVVHVKAAPQSNELEKIGRMQVKDHPAYDGRGQPLPEGKTNAEFLSELELNNPLSYQPENGGYQKMITVDGGASRWFSDPNIARLAIKSPITALIRSNCAYLWTSDSEEGSAHIQLMAYALLAEWKSKAEDLPAPPPVAGGISAVMRNRPPPPLPAPPTPQGNTTQQDSDNNNTVFNTSKKKGRGKRN